MRAGRLLRQAGNVVCGVPVHAAGAVELFEGRVPPAVVPVWGKKTISHVRETGATRDTWNTEYSNNTSNHMMLVNRSLTTSLLSLALHIHCYCVMHDSSVVDTMLSILLCDAFTLGPSVWFAERHIRSLSHQCLCVQRMALRVACSSMRAA